MIIREYTSADRSRIEWLRMQMRKTDSRDLDILPQQLRDFNEKDWHKLEKGLQIVPPASIFLVLEHRKRIIGLLHVHREGKSGWSVMAFYILPKYRGMGGGRELMKQMLSRIEQVAPGDIELLVSAKQEAALAVCRRFGFSPMEIVLMKSTVKSGLEQWFHMVRSHPKPA